MKFSLYKLINSLDDIIYKPLSYSSAIKIFAIKWNSWKSQTFILLFPSCHFYYHKDKILMKKC